MLNSVGPTLEGAPWCAGRILLCIVVLSLLLLLVCMVFCCCSVYKYCLVLYVVRFGRFGDLLDSEIVKFVITLLLQVTTARVRYSDV